MLIEIKMADGEKLRMEAEKLDWSNDKVRIENGGYYTFFNVDHVMYAGRVDRIYTEGQEEMKPVLKRMEVTQPMFGDGHTYRKTYDYWECPGCGERFGIDDKHNFCPKCGQALGWGGDEDE